MPVLVLSIVLNIPKFLEPKFTWKEVNSTISGDLTLNGTFESDNITEVEKEYEIGKLNQQSVVNLHSFDFLLKLYTKGLCGHFQTSYWAKQTFAVASKLYFRQI